MQLLPLSLPPAFAALYYGSFFIVWSLLSIIFCFSLVLFRFLTFQAKSYNTEENRMVRSLRLPLSGESSNVGRMWCQCYGSSFSATVADDPYTCFKVGRSKHVSNLGFLKRLRLK